MPLRTIAKLACVMAGTVLMAMPRVALCADGDAMTLGRVEHEIQRLKDERERDRQAIDDLERTIQQLKEQNQRLNAATQRSHEEFTQKFESVEHLVKEEASSSAASVGFLGEHQFVAAGGGAVTYLYDRQSNINTFAAEFEPLLLYRLNDWLLFEGVIDASLPAGSGASFDLPVATAQMFLNDHAEINAGIFDLPFGDFNEGQSVFWANRFVSAPLPYGSAGLLPGSDLGMQLRGGFQWGSLGQDLDYTVYASNGPLYDTALPQPVAGQTFNGNNNISLNTHGRTWGGRFRIYPFPLDSNLGRLELGASTYDGTWLNGLWLTSWGLGFNYHRDAFEARGEYLETHRQMPSGGPADNRQGWYVQTGYYLTGLHLSSLGRLNNGLNKLELLIRYSGLNQRAVVESEIPSAPGSLGQNVSESLFVPHPREVALGLDYWLAPSIVWKLEYDLELPEAGGSAVTFGPAGAPIFSRATNVGNDRAVLSQIAIGF